MVFLWGISSGSLQQFIWVCASEVDMNLVSLLIILLVFCVVIWAARALMTAFSIGDPIATVVYVLLVLIMLLWIVQSLGFIHTGLRLN